MRASIFLQVDLLVENGKAGVYDSKIEPDQRFTVRSDDAFYAVDIHHFLRVARLVGIGELVEELIGSYFAEGTLVSGAFTPDSIIQAEVKKSKVVLVSRSDILCVAMVL